MRSFFRAAMLLLCGVSAAACLSGCSGNSDNENGASGNVTIFVARSTADAVEAIADEYEAVEPSVSIRISAASSGSLAQQIAHGAAADLFLSANEKWMDYLEDEGLVRQRTLLLGNELVVVVPADAQREITSLEDLADDAFRQVALADTESAPAGMYARQALTAAGVWPQIEPKVISGADVRQTLFHVESGVEVGIVYATDAAVSQDVRIAMTVDPALYPEIHYPLALLEPGEDKASARKFFEFIATSPTSHAAFQKRGFKILLEPAAKPE